MSKLMSKESINTILAILFGYLYTHYIAPFINRFFDNFFVSWGLILILFGVWGILAKMVLIQSVFISASKKGENYFLIILRFFLSFTGIFKMVS